MATTSGGASGRSPGVRIEGLAELRRALRRIDKTLDRGLAVKLRSVGQLVQGAARREADKFRKSGRLSGSIRVSVRQRQASIYSNLPQAPVHEYGGTIRPRGVPIAIPRREYMRRGVANSRRRIDAELEDILDAIADEWGEGPTV
jgi:phage gpG-like protein